MQKILIIIILASLSQIGISQENYSIIDSDKIEMLKSSLIHNSKSSGKTNINRNNLYGTIGYIYIHSQLSINYERLLIHKPDAIFHSAWLGATYGKNRMFYVNDSEGPYGILSLKSLLGKGNSHAEFGLGCNAYVESWDETKDIDYYPVVSLGYRYQKQPGHFVLRTGVETLYLSFFTFYASIGFSF